MIIKDVAIVAATRTAIGRFQGGLSRLPAAELGASVIRALLAQTQVLPERIDEVILSQVLCAGDGQNPARQAALQAGLHHHTPAMTINKVCGGGLKAVQLGAQAIALGEAEVVIAGGQENMSRAAHVLPESRTGQRLGHWELIDTLLNDGLTCASNRYHMGQTAENVAKHYHISREAQDAFALQSQQRAQAAIESGVFKGEISPVSVPQRDGSVLEISEDEHPRFNSQASDLSAMRPAFVRNGSVTAGNASGLNDGAAAVLLMSAEQAKAASLEPLAYIRCSATAGVDPAMMGIGPIAATERCLAKAQWSVDSLEVIEANEAFAAQAIAVNQALGWPAERVNVHGGAIALGHPIGASGCRILVTLVHEMRRRAAQRGLATLCIGGGMGIAMALERR